jgi:hypothetical protein
VGKVQRTQQSYDADLVEQGLRRSYRMDITEDGQPIYREHTVKIADYTEDKTPWWKQNTQKKKRSKSSKA